MADGLLEAVRGLRLANPQLGPKPLLAKLREQQPGLGAGNKEVREALTEVKAESEAKAAAALVQAVTATALPAEGDVDALCARQSKLQALQAKHAAVLEELDEEMAALEERPSQKALAAHQAKYEAWKAERKAWQAESEAVRAEMVAEMVALKKQQQIDAANKRLATDEGDLIERLGCFLRELPSHAALHARESKLKALTATLLAVKEELDEEMTALQKRPSLKALTAQQAKYEAWKAERKALMAEIEALWAAIEAALTKKQAETEAANKALPATDAALSLACIGCARAAVRHG